MTTPILLFLLLFVLQSYLAPSIRYLMGDPSQGSSGGTVGDRLKIALGPRDEQPPLSPLAGRAQRAFANLQEAAPVFLTLALLHVFESGEGSPQDAIYAAWLFVVARMLYVPAYLSGVPGLRSAVWAVGFGALAVMAWGLATQLM